MEGVVNEGCIKIKGSQVESTLRWCAFLNWVEKQSGSFFL
jgi:hypothetical protein